MAVRRPLPPWWIWVVGALLCLAASVLLSSHLVWPIGWRALRTSSPRGEPVWIVSGVEPDSPAARAGLEVGDSIRGSDLESMMAALQPGGEHRIAVERRGVLRVFTIRLDPRDLNYWRSRVGVGSLLSIAASLLGLALAWLLVFIRPRDPTARWGAFFLGELAVLSGAAVAAGVVPESFALVHRLGFPLGTLAMVGVWIAVLQPATAVTFLGSFPREPFRGRTLALLWAPAVVTIPLDINLWRLAHPAARGPSIPKEIIAVAMITGGSYMVVGALLLVRNFRRLTDANERRRTKILVIGLVITSTAGAVNIFYLTPSESVERLRTHFQWLIVAWPIFASAAPIATACAILRHRVFDVSVMVRLGLRYAAARGLLLSLVPLMGVGFVADVLLHGNQPLVEIFRQRGWLYAGLAVAAYVLHTRRKTWVTALDRRYFRERYDAQQILGAVVEEVRRSTDFGQAAPSVIARAESALHPEFAALLVREVTDANFRVAASTGMPPPALPSGSKLLSLVRVLGKPVEVPPDESGWVTRQLPPDESDFVRRHRIEWVFPIFLGEEEIEALLLLGPKRSEEPYSKEDQDLLQAITASLAMLLERSVPVAPKVGFEECPECGVCYEPGEALCIHDGVSLSRLSTSRTVDGRYRLDRRLGQGGMGTVYQAFDGELERNVAVKLIRPELVAGADAVARFKWEAKAAGGFTHANVVTIYDFGVAEDGRAYTVLELLEGCTLRQELERFGRFEAPRVVSVMRGVCAATTSAHERGLLHRDLKPENIFLTRRGGEESVKVLDFGLVKQLAGFGEARESLDTTAGVLVGTLRYMAPEQLRGGSPSPSWDLWALAIVAYEMLVGTYPFAAPQQIGELMVPRALSPVADHLPDAPRGWQNFFEKALSPDLATRPSSARNLFSELEAVAGAAEADATGSSPATPAGRGSDLESNVRSL